MKTIICMTTLILSITSCSEKQAGNPLLEHFTTPHQTPPFDRIETRHYEPAFDQAIEEAKQEFQLRQKLRTLKIPSWRSIRPEKN